MHLQTVGVQLWYMHMNGVCTYAHIYYVYNNCLRKLPRHFPYRCQRFRLVRRCVSVGAGLWSPFLYGVEREDLDRKTMAVPSRHVADRPINRTTMPRTALARAQACTPTASSTVHAAQANRDGAGRERRAGKGMILNLHKKTSVPSTKHLVSVYYIFQNLVQRMPHVRRAVCKRWPVVHDKLGRSCSFSRSSTTHVTRSTLPFVHVLEAGGDLGLTLGCICTHGEFGLWQQQRLVVRTLQRCNVAHTKRGKCKKRREARWERARKC